MSRRREKPCGCARCTGAPTADPRYGYDRAAVPAVECLDCGRPIGAAPYREVTTLARFGQMFFAHLRCPGGVA